MTWTIFALLLISCVLALGLTARSYALIRAPARYPRRGGR